MRLHTGEKPFECRACQTFFSTPSGLKGHRQAVHSDERKHKCKECSKSFKQAKTLKIHELTHTKSKPFSCSLCGKTFSQSSNRNTHIRRYHSKIDPVSCDVCQKVFKAPEFLKEHMYNMHDGKGYPCKECGQICRSKYYLETQHMLQHTGERPYACNYCEKAFNRKTNLDVHTKWHSGVSYRRERNHTCKFCQRPFTVNGLKKHMGSYNQTKNFRCNNCSKSFTGKCNLNIHLKSC